VTVVDTPAPARAPDARVREARVGLGRGRAGRGGRGRGRRQHALLRLRGEIPLWTRIALAVAGIVVLVACWWVAADLIVQQPYLRSPLDTVRGLETYWSSGDFWPDVEASGLRILKGYSISLAIGAVLGVLIGSFRSVEAVWESPIGFLRYIPATALTPVFLAWLGIDESPKVALVIAGTVFFNIVMMADVARLVPRELILTAYTLGAGRARVMRRVVLPHCLPGMIDVARVNLAAAWPMLVVAELLAATDGLGYRLTVLRRGNDYAQIFAVLLVFAVIGITSDLVLRWLRNRVSPWARS
jgi:NitT/TauT family transport system permease protein